MTDANSFVTVQAPRSRAKWIEAMAWMYWTVCVADFLLFPIGGGILYSMYNRPYQEWHPYTLQGGAMFHVSMAAILGISTYQRSQEALAHIGLGSTTSSSTQTTTTSDITTKPPVTTTTQTKSSRSD